MCFLFLVERVVYALVWFLVYSYYSEVSNISKLEKLLREGHLPITSGVFIIYFKAVKSLWL